MRLCESSIDRFQLHNFSLYDITYDETFCFDLFALQLPGLGDAAHNRSENRQSSTLRAVRRLLIDC